MGVGIYGACAVEGLALMGHKAFRFGVFKLKRRRVQILGLLQRAAKALRPQG